MPHRLTAYNGELALAHCPQEIGQKGGFPFLARGQNVDCWIGLFEGHDVVNQRHLPLKNLQGVERVQNFLLCHALHVAVCLVDLHI